jgi:hypothetical protein
LDTRHGNSVDRQAKAEHNVSVTEQLMRCTKAKGLLPSVFQLAKTSHRLAKWGSRASGRGSLNGQAIAYPGLTPSAGQRRKQCK